MVTAAGDLALAGARGYLAQEFADGKHEVKSDAELWSCKLRVVSACI